MLVYWFGYGGSKHLAEELRPLIEKLNCKLVTMSEWEDSDVLWNKDTWLQELKKADVIIIPCNYNMQPAKSNNRLTQALSLGKPVICSPLDAYWKVNEKFPGCCLFASNLNEWEFHLTELRDNEELCKILTERAFRAAAAYSIQEITKKWIDVIEKSDTLDIIIPSYNNVEYLKLCIHSIRKNTKAYNIIISDAGSNASTWEFYKILKNMTILGEQDKRLNFSQTCNAGIKHSTSEYFVLLNSDTIVSKNWDINLLKKMQADKNLAACGVLSNCDRYWLHDAPGKPSYPMSIPGLDLVPGMKACQLEDRLEDLYRFMENSNNSHAGTLVEQEWVAYYATIFNRKIFDNVGLLDPGFKNGCEDLDFCIRIKKMRYKIAQAIDSFVFHFGGITRGSYEIEGKESYHQEDRENHAYLKEKWGDYRQP